MNVSREFLDPFTDWVSLVGSLIAATKKGLRVGLGVHLLSMLQRAISDLKSRAGE